MSAPGCIECRGPVTPDENVAVCAHCGNDVPVCEWCCVTTNGWRCTSCRDAEHEFRIMDDELQEDDARPVVLPRRLFFAKGDSVFEWHNGRVSRVRHRREGGGFWQRLSNWIRKGGL